MTGNKRYIYIHSLFLLPPGDTARFSSYGRMGYVHIDDVASSHILVYEVPQAAGRYLCSSVVLDNDELVSSLAKRYPIFPIPRRSVVVASSGCACHFKISERRAVCMVRSAAG